MKEYKNKLRKYYNSHVDERNENVKAEWKLQLRKELLSIMKESSFETLLEIGAGTGQGSLFFKENGLTVTAVDLSDEHVEKCREKGIDAYVMDFSDLQFKDATFDCVYALNCLLHVPNSEIVGVLCELKRVTKNNGMLFLCQYGGIDEEVNKGSENDDGRFFSFRTLQTFLSFTEDAGLKHIKSKALSIGFKNDQAHCFILKNSKSIDNI